MHPLGRAIIYPSVWKIARVTPSYKGGSKTERDNQRPISCILMVYESFANTDLQEFASEISLINNENNLHMLSIRPYGRTNHYRRFLEVCIEKGKKVVCAFLDMRSNGLKITYKRELSSSRAAASSLKLKTFNYA